MSGPSLGYSLIKSMGGKNWPLKRSVGGYYVDGVYVDRIPNQSQPIDFDANLAKVQTLVREITGMSAAVVTIIEDGYSIDFGVFGAQSLLQVVLSTLEVVATVTRIELGDEDHNEIQTVTFAEELTEGRFSLSLGAPAPNPASVVFASKQPVTGREVVRIPEGDRTRQRHKLYASDFLRSIEEVGAASADIVVIGGEDFQVESVEPWTSFYKAIIVKVERIQAT